VLCCHLPLLLLLLVLCLQLFAFCVDAIAIVIGSLLGCAPLTVYIESASGEQAIGIWVYSRRFLACAAPLVVVSFLLSAVVCHSVHSWILCFCNKPLAVAP
jgi:xanthine/uracil/vitamin C permease (AzgA family)